MVEVCAQISDSTLERIVIVSISTEDNTALGTSGSERVGGGGRV